MKQLNRTRLIGSVCAPLMLVTAALAAPAAWAGWNSGEETLNQHPTWIYTPSSTMSNGKRALMLVLHGCGQTNDEIKTGGNLTGTAEAKGIVMAVPDVGSEYFGTAAQRCWDYNGATDSKGHIAELVSLATTLKNRAGLNIDPNHIYITGLSSGAGMALDVGCKAPDLFAGVGAVAGPSVGSNQNMALQNAPSTATQTAISTCNSLAGGKSSFFATQVANIAYGNMDKNGSQANCNYPVCSTPGKVALVDVHWSDQHNVNALRSIYGAGSLSSASAVPGGGDQRIALKDGKQRISLLQIYSVGHAWPAGGGPGAGTWVANFGLNYIDYVSNWFLANNLRGTVQGDPTVSASGSVSGTTVNVSGSASDSDGSITRIDTALLKKDSGGNFAQVSSHPNIGSGTSYSDSYTGLADGVYKVRVTVTDNTSKTASTDTAELTVGTPAGSCTDYTSTNYAHVQQGRATTSGGYVYAKGSNQLVGLFNLQTSTLRETQPGYFEVGACP